MLLSVRRQTQKREESQAFLLLHTSWGETVDVFFPRVSSYSLGEEVREDDSSSDEERYFIPDIPKKVRGSRVMKDHHRQRLLFSL
jgi:hypothetical protein